MRSSDSHSCAPSSTLNGIGGRIFRTLRKPALRAEQDAVLAHPVRDVRRLARSPARACRGSYQLDAEEQPGAADVADQRDAGRASARKRVEHADADVPRVGLQPFLRHHVEHREPDRARDRVAAERAEEFHPVVERRGNRRRGDHRANRMPVADRLAEDDDVGDDALGFEGVEVCAKATVRGLHLVGDADAAGGPHDRVDTPRGSPAGRMICPPTLGALSAMNAADAEAARSKRLHGLRDLRRVPAGRHRP